MCLYYCCFSVVYGFRVCCVVFWGGFVCLFVFFTTVRDKLLVRLDFWSDTILTILSSVLNVQNTRLQRKICLVSICFYLWQSTLDNVFCYCLQILKISEAISLCNCRRCSHFVRVEGNTWGLISLVLLWAREKFCT